MKQRNYAIDVIKVLFAIIIALGHYGLAFGDSGLIVNLFFVISGFFLVKSSMSSKYKDTWDYTISRLKRIYPYYFWAFFIMALSSCIQNQESFIESIKTFGHAIPEMLLLQNVGIFDGGINYPLWFLCECIIGSHILFALVKWNCNITLNAICPMIFICGTAYFVNNDVDVWLGTFGGCLALPLLRAFVCLALGMAIYTPITKILEKIQKYTTRKANILMGIYGIVCLAICYIDRKDKYISLLSFCLLMLFLLYPGEWLKSIFNHKIFRHCEKLSLGIFLNHAVIISWLQYFNVECTHLNAIILLVFVSVYSIVMFKMTDFILKIIKKRIQEGISESENRAR